MARNFDTFKETFALVNAGTDRMTQGVSRAWQERLGLDSR